MRKWVQTYFKSLILVGLFVLTTSFYIHSETILIRIYTATKINSLNISANAGKYRLLGDGALISEPAITSVYKIIAKNDSVVVFENDKQVGTYKYLKFSGDALSELKLKLINPDRRARLYQNNLSLSVIDGYLQLINEVELDNYIAGVSEAEAGTRSTQEF
jgi:hypothetical protein